LHHGAIKGYRIFIKWNYSNSSFQNSAAPEMPDISTEVVAKLMSFISDFESSSFSTIKPDEERESKELQRRKSQKFTPKLGKKVSFQN
jgi:hypothetical protein